ncbi:immunity 22 family protein [Burkholderia sp. AU32357]|nr:immunity 22 family protein [Burkholderia sp. AU32357]
MEKANKVSVWVGKFTDDDDLTDYIENAYDENGTLPISFETIPELIGLTMTSVRRACCNRI